jgi:hypothetical protein
LTIRELLFVVGVIVAGAVPFVLDFSRAAVLIWYVSVLMMLAVGLLRTIQMHNRRR